MRMVLTKLKKMENKFKIQLSVRDYECDMVMHVNNSVYMNYLEHCRHEFIKTMGINFSEYAKRGIGLIITRTELNYKNALNSGDIFYVTAVFKRESKLRFRFEQEIYKEDGTVAVTAETDATVIGSDGRPIRMPLELEDAIQKYFKELEDE